MLAMLLVAGSLLPGAAAAQRSLDPVSEGQRLRQAAARESRGEYDQAARLLREILDDNPVSTGALFALERVLRAAGDVGAVLPAVEQFLAADPLHPGPHTMRLRVYAELDSLAALRRAGEAWLAAAPRDADAYREVARAFGEAFGGDEALAVLERGRSTLSRADLFALEMGDLRLASGDTAAALAEWAAAVGPEGERASAVLRRVTALEPDVARAAGRLVAALDREPTTSDRRRTAARIALEAGLGGEARRLAERAIEPLDAGAREGFLVTLARRA
ncbi:MAG: hypothetical protein D6701_03850, partial [Gemmatimonadetes bacterium]